MVFSWRKEGVQSLGEVLGTEEGSRCFFLSFFFLLRPQAVVNLGTEYLAISLERRGGAK